MKHDLEPELRQARELLRNGETISAAALLQRVVAAHPDCGPAYEMLGVISLVGGAPQQGLEQLRRAASLGPIAAENSFHLGQHLFERGELDLAIAHLRAAAALPTARFQHWHALATAYISRGGAVADELNKALDACKASVPSDPAMLLALGNVLAQSGRGEEASAVLRQLIAAFPGVIQAHLELAKYHMEQGDGAAEIEVLRSAIRAIPGSGELHLQLARALEDEGDAEGARRAYVRARQIDPRSYQSLSGLLKLDGAAAEEALVEEAQTLLQHGGTSNAAVAAIAYSMGKVQAARRQDEQAFQSWNRANAARRLVSGPYDRQALLDRVGSVIEGFTPEFLAQRRQWGVADARPVFIVGVPRSGTTLVEQIIAAHPACAGVGELPHIPMLAGQLAATAGASATPADLARSLKPEAVRSIAHAYLATLDRRARPQALRVVDKLPTNFFHLGLIALMFPRAHFIWCRRDPLDACLSMYSEDLAVTQRYSTDLGDLGLYFRQHERLMAHWKQCGLAVHEVPYEALVHDLEGGSRALIAHLGLEWDAACLDFHARAATVATPSRWQVRQPVYTTSVGRWRRYEPWLGPLMRALHV